MTQQVRDALTAWATGPADMPDPHADTIRFRRHPKALVHKYEPNRPMPKAIPDSVIEYDNQTGKLNFSTGAGSGRSTVSLDSMLSGLRQDMGRLGEADNPRQIAADNVSRLFDDLGNLLQETAG